RAVISVVEVVATAPAPAPTPPIVPIPRNTARPNTDPKSGLSTIPTVSVTQYDCSNGTNSDAVCARATQQTNRSTATAVSGPATIELSHLRTLRSNGSCSLRARVAQGRIFS